MNKVDGAKAESDTSEEFVFAVEHVVKDVSLSQSGCEVSEDGLVMIDSEHQSKFVPIVRKIDSS